MMTPNDPAPDADPIELTTALQALAHDREASPDFQTRVLGQARQMTLHAQDAEAAGEDVALAAALQACASEASASPEFQARVMTRVQQPRRATEAGVPAPLAHAPSLVQRVGKRVHDWWAAVQASPGSQPRTFRLRLRDLVLVGATACATCLFVWIPLKFHYETMLRNTLGEETTKILLAAQQHFKGEEGKKDFAQLLTFAAATTNTLIQLPEVFSTYVVVDEHNKDGESFLCGKGERSPADLVWLSSSRQAATGQQESLLRHFAPKRMDVTDCQALAERHGIRSDMAILIISRYDSIRLYGDVVKTPVFVEAKIGPMDKKSAVLWGEHSM
jgi:hypothetical protein